MSYKDKVVSEVKCGVCGVMTKSYALLVLPNRKPLWGCLWHKSKESNSEHEKTA